MTLPHGATTWSVLGGTGFVGSEIVRELRHRGQTVSVIAAPRLLLRGARSAENGRRHVTTEHRTVNELSGMLRGTDVLVNAAGVAAPDSGDTDELFGANALLPGVVASAAVTAGVPRLIHLSSAAVLGPDAPLHDRRDTRPFSPYSRSKALAEEILIDQGTSPGSLDLCVVRASSVHGPGRSTTLKLQRIARSSLSSVASPGEEPSPVSSIYGLAEFVVDLGSSSGPLPDIVVQPWEGSTTSSVLRLAGDGREPKVLPRSLCTAVVSMARIVSRLTFGRLDGPVRRLELMWFGQIPEDHSAVRPSDHLERALRPTVSAPGGRT